jgi:circadian clock protein KaiB
MTSTIFKFRLYIAGDTQNSIKARANLSALCEAHLQKRHKIEVVDVLREPKRALAEGIFMTPTLLKLAPWPVQKIIGTLEGLGQVLEVVGLRAPIA